MKAKIHIVTIDTQELECNPYSMFLIDALCDEGYSIDYFSNEGKGDYKDIPNYKINTFLLKLVRNLLRILVFIYYLIQSLFSKKLTIKVVNSLSVYVSGILIKNVYLFFYFLFRKCSGDTFIVVSAGAMLAFAWLKRIKDIRYIYCIYEVYPFQNLETIHMQRWRYWIERTGIKQADLILDTGDRKISTFLRRVYKVEMKQVANILIMPPMATSFARSETTYPIKFYYHGSYAPNRGLEELLEAMVHIPGDKGNLYLRGIGGYRKVLEEIVERLQLNDKVFFLEPVKTTELVKEATKFDVGLVMVRMNIYNHKFVIGFKTFENMTAGLAGIAPDSFNLHRLIVDNRVGVVYKDATVDQLYKAMQYCIDNLDFVDSAKANSIKLIETIGQQYQYDTVRSIMKRFIEQ